MENLKLEVNMKKHEGIIVIVVLAVLVMLLFGLSGMFFSVAFGG